MARTLKRRKKRKQEFKRLMTQSSERTLKRRKKKEESLQELETGIICFYCKFYWKYPLDKKKGFKICEVANFKKITRDSATCNKYYPAKNIYCHINRYWLDLIVCLKRRKDKKELCRKCRFYHKSIVQVVQNYYKEIGCTIKEREVLADLGILKRPKKIKRRKKKELPKPKRRVLKRRKRKGVKMSESKPFVLNDYNCPFHGWLLNIEICRVEKEKGSKKCRDCSEFIKQFERQMKTPRIYYNEDSFKCKKLNEEVTGLMCVTRALNGYLMGMGNCNTECSGYLKAIGKKRKLKRRKKRSLKRRKK